MAISRDKKLKKQFNSFWNEILSKSDSKNDLYGTLSIENFIKLKQAISNINNIITLQTTQKFVDFLFTEKIITRDQKKEMKALVDSVNANANGYDVDFPLEKNKYDGIIAEVKCNIPVAKHSFGANQEQGIIKDFENLLKGKNKVEENKANYLKFMVVLESKDSVRESMQKIINKYKGGKVMEYKPGCTLSCDTVYVVYIPIK